MPTVLNDYYRARYYHPTFQRFVGEDPLSFAGGDANLYAYVANNPTNARDPSGLMALSATLGVTLGGSILVKTAFGAGVGVIADAMGQLLATGTVDPIGLVIAGAAGALGGRAAFQAAAAGLLQHVRLHSGH